jgi:hypothetical protein
MFNISSTSSNKKCLTYTASLPSFSPIINSLSSSSSVAGKYALIYVTGANFFPNGTTYINFGIFKNISVTFYSSFNISFVVPLNAPKGIYNVVAVNIYNGNFSSPVGNTYPANLNYSSSIIYEVL